MTDPSPSVVFETPNKANEIIKMSFDDVDFIITSTQLSHSKLWPDEPPSEEQLKNPAYRRIQATEMAGKFIPALTAKFNEQYNTTFREGTINALFKKHTTVSQSLKKNTVVPPSSQPSTDSTPADSATNPTPTT